ncbi:glycogen-binding subunit 76A isoform X1 [Papilio machaon]|uniref:glycogen-binding subunit 76A isoform X1 n=1 Tax=Papilio machaon TaxID=76193 RepID=UPI001E663EDF|nr:glycogen-binding subunit 76A isoform X1 [Papilio machaon]
MDQCKQNSEYNSPGINMSLEHQMPVLMKKTQMSGDRAGSGTQCGLTSLLPMSCRGRAAAFARDLHSRLRNLGAGHDDSESSWLARDTAPTHRPANSAQRDLDTFYDFELECESPSSPVEEYDAAFPERAAAADTVRPFCDVDTETEIKEQARLMLKHPDNNKNGFKFSTAFYTDYSPVKLQPVPRENGHTDKPLYSPISFEGCARQNSYDEIDCAVRSPAVVESERLSSPLNHSTIPDSDSEFESAKSDPSEANDEVTLTEKSLENDVTEGIENLSIIDLDLGEDEIPVDNIDIKVTAATDLVDSSQIITSEASEHNEMSPTPEIDPKLLSTEEKEEEETEDDRPQRVRRCSSLKTGKTPPGTPGRKKIVRFADVLGLDLADVKTFMDEIPVIPKSAYDDLTGCDMLSSSPPARAPPRLGTLTLVPLFQVPRDVTEKLEKMLVCLESARVCEGAHVTVCGSVRVRNLDFHKTVHIRYTMNRWKTYTDLQATYVQGSCDGYSDRFQFVLYAPCISSGQRLELAVRFQCKGQQFWDNNSGANYCFDCFGLGATSPAALIQTAPAALHPPLDWHPSFY